MAPCPGPSLDGAQFTAHLFGRQRAAVKAETVSTFFRGESVGKDAGHVFGWNSATAVGDGYADGVDWRIRS